MKNCIFVDTTTGRILGRVTLPNTVNPLPPGYIEVGDGVTEQEWELRPELLWRFDAEAKRLVDLPVDEKSAVQKNAPVIPPTPEDSGK